MTAQIRQAEDGVEHRMAQININESHKLGAAEARRRVDAYADELADSTFPGIRIEDVQKSWDGESLQTSFKASKGFFSKQITGSMQVEETSVTLEVEVPDLVFALMPRPEVESRIREKLREKLA